jgi:hypothetical protein
VSLAIAAIGTSTPCELSKVVRPPLGFAVFAAGELSVVLELPAFSVLFEFALGADVASAAAAEVELPSVPAELASALAEAASDPAAEAEAALLAPPTYR